MQSTAKKVSVYKAGLCARLAAWLTSKPFASRWIQRETEDLVMYQIDWHFAQSLYLKKNGVYWEDGLVRASASEEDIRASIEHMLSEVLKGQSKLDGDFAFSAIILHLTTLEHIARSSSWLTRVSWPVHMERLARELGGCIGELSRNGLLAQTPGGVEIK